MGGGHQNGYMVMFCGVPNDIGMICMSKYENGRKVIFSRFRTGFVISIFFMGMIQTHTPVVVRIRKLAETNLLDKGITKKGKLLHF